MEWLLTPWKMFMLGLFVFLLLHRVGGRWPVHKLRTWAALFGTSVAGAVLTPEHGATPYLAYMALCFAGGWVVLIHPAGIAQRAIGLLFAAMLLFHAGAAFAGHPNGGPAYWQMMIGAGWLQFAILLVWSFWDAGLAKLVRAARRRLGGKVIAASHRGSAQ